jgi:hypothetical protein
MNSPQPWWLIWPVAEVAAAILPLFAHPPFSPCSAEDGAVNDVVAWCKTGTPSGPRRFPGWFSDPEFRAIAEAIQVLEHAGLLMRALTVSDNSDNNIGLTRLGQHALGTNTVRQHLGLCDAPPAG